MFPILYPADTAKADFIYNGYGFIKNCTKCSATEERNGPYELGLEMLTNDRLARTIMPGMFVKSLANPYDPAQLFEIYNVSYTNLNTELEYKVEAVLVEKSSGRKVGVNGKIVTNTVNFVPKTADGNITVPLSFNVTNLKSGEYVVFEKVYEINPETGKENLVGSHEDLKDSAQTVRVPNRPGRRVQTGDFPVVPVATGAAIILVIVSVVVVMRKKKG